MEQIRKGNDIKVYWEIITGGDGSEIPYELEGKALELYVQNAYEKVRISDFVANGNVIEWTFYGKDQKTAGVYSLTLIENNGSEGMRTVDECNAFELVMHSCKTGGNAESRVSIETVRLRSVMTLSDVVPDKELNKNSTNVVENGAIAREFEKQNGAMAKKQDIIPDLAIIREGASKGATALQEHQDISGKADTSGRYPEMSVGFADDLVGRGESVPAEFSFRASGGKSIKDGSARIKRLKGNSVVWNNMVDTRGYENGAVIREGIKIQQGHKYLLQRSAANKGLYLIPVVDGSESYDMVLRDGEHAKIFVSQYTDTTDARVLAEGYCGACVISDLTKMFQAGNEPSTIEEYEARKPIVADEYAYNEGEVIHMTAEGIKSVGDNAWDEEWRLGIYGSSEGIYVQNSSCICNARPIRVLPNTEYYFKPGVEAYAFYYDKNMIFIKYEGGYGVIKTPSNAEYLNFYLGAGYGTQYNNDILISLYHSGWKADTDAKYQPYWEDRLMFDKRIKDEFPNGMQRWDMVYNKNGKGYIVKGTYEVKMKDLNIRRDAEGVFIAQPIPAVAKTDSKGWSAEIVSARFIGDGTAYSYNLSPYNSAFIVEDSLWINGQPLASYMTKEDFIRDYGDDILYYQLAEPTIIEYDEPFNLDYKVADFGTEEIIAPQPSAPISADIIYQFNAVDMIREHELEITELQRIIATMQAQLTSLTSNNGGQ